MAFLRMFLICWLMVSLAYAQSTREVAELIQTGHPVNLRAGGNANWEELGKTLGDARVVVIGGNPAQEGDLALRVQLTRFLKEKMGFGVLLLDAGLFDGEKARETYQFGGLGRGVLATSLPYGMAAGLEPLATLMDIGSDRTTAFVQGGYLAYSHLAAPGLALSLREYLQTRVPEQAENKHFVVLNQTLACFAPIQLPVVSKVPRLALGTPMPGTPQPQGGPIGLKDIDTLALGTALAALRQQLDACDKLFPKQRPTSDFYREALIGVQMMASGMVRGTSGYARKIAAHHLAWLVEKRYPTEKIVIWADNAGAIHPDHGQAALAAYQSVLTDFQVTTLAKTKTLGMTGRPVDIDVVENALSNFEGWIPVTGKATMFGSTALGMPLVAAWGKVYDALLVGPQEPATELGAAYVAQSNEGGRIPIRVLVLDSVTHKPVAFSMLQVGTLAFVTQENGMCDMRIPMQFADEVAVIKMTGYQYKPSLNILENIMSRRQAEAGKPTPIEVDTIYVAQAVRQPSGTDAAQVLKEVARHRAENHPSLAVEQRGVLRTGPADSVANVVAAAVLQRRNGFSPANQWFTTRSTGVQLLAVNVPAFEKPAAARADEALAEVLQADVVASAIGPLGTFSQAAFTFVHEGSFVWDRQTVCHKVSYRCARPGVQVLGLAGVTTCEGVIWVEDKSFAVIRSELKLTFADARTLTRTAIYSNRGKEGWAPIFLQAKHVSAKGETRWDEWYTRTTTNAVVKPIYGSFASAQVPPVHSPVFWQSYWQYCWGK